MKLSTRAHSRLNNQLGRCPPAGSGVHSWIMSCASLAAMEGISPVEAESAILGAMSRPPSPSNEVETAIRPAYADLGTGGGPANYRPGHSPSIKPKPLPMTVQAFVRQGGGAGENEWLEASPIQFSHAPGPHQALVLVNALYTSEDFLYCGEKYGEDVTAVWRLRGQIADGEMVPPHVIPNPMTGRTGYTQAGKLSYRCDNTVAEFRFAVAEMDEGLTKADQLAFWWGFKSAPIAALIDSGGKSIHAWLKVDRPNRASWERDVEQTLFDRVLIPLGCDRQCRNESRMSRMPGHYRAEKGAWQRLLYLNPEAVR